MLLKGNNFWKELEEDPHDFAMQARTGDLLYMYNGKKLANVAIISLKQAIPPKSVKTENEYH